MKDIAPMNEPYTDLQEKAGNFISEISKYTTPYGVFSSELAKYSSLDPDDTWIKICFTGYGITECDGLAIEALYIETDIPKLAKYCVRSVLSSALLSSLEYNIGG